MSYLQKGELSGAEYLNLTRDQDFTLWGVEDEKLYWQSLETYRSIAKQREKFQDYLQKIEVTINTLKPKLFNPSLLFFDQKHEDFLKEKISLTDYFTILAQESRQSDIDTNHYSHIQKLEELKDKEQKINWKLANEEEQKTAQLLTQEELGSLKLSSLSKLTGQDHKNQDAFLALLEEKLKDKDEYPELKKYFHYLKESKKLDTRKILEEQKLLEQQIYESLIQTPDEERLHKASKNLRSLKALLNLTLTPDEFHAYEENPKDFDLIQMTGFLNKKILDLKDHYDRAIFLEQGYEDVLKKAQDFYKLTRQRDEVFVQKTLKKMDQLNLQKAVLVTGGYHSPNLKALLKDKNISFICVTPQILHETNLKRYEELLLNQKAPAHQNTQSPADKIAVLVAASRLASDRLVTMQRLADELGIQKETSFEVATKMNAGARLAARDGGRKKSGKERPASTWRITRSRFLRIAAITIGGGIAGLWGLHHLISSPKDPPRIEHPSFERVENYVARLSKLSSVSWKEAQFTKVYVASNEDRLEDLVLESRLKGGVKLGVSFQQSIDMAVAGDTDRFYFIDISPAVTDIAVPFFGILSENLHTPRDLLSYLLGVHLTEKEFYELLHPPKDLSEAALDEYLFMKLSGILQKKSIEEREKWFDENILPIYKNVLFPLLEKYKRFSSEEENIKLGQSFSIFLNLFHPMRLREPHQASDREPLVVPATFLAFIKHHAKYSMKGYADASWLTPANYERFSKMWADGNILGVNVDVTDYDGMKRIADDITESKKRVSMMYLSNIFQYQDAETVCHMNDTNLRPFPWEQDGTLAVAATVERDASLTILMRNHREVMDFYRDALKDIKEGRIEAKPSEAPNIFKPKGGRLARDHPNASRLANWNSASLSRRAFTRFLMALSLAPPSLGNVLIQQADSLALVDKPETISALSTAPPTSALADYFKVLGAVSSGSWEHAEGAIYWASTDSYLHRFFKAVANRRGTMIGVSFQQNFSMALHNQSSTYVVADINPIDTEIMVPFFGYLVERARSRRELLSWMLGIQLSDEDVKRLLEPKKEKEGSLTEYLDKTLKEIIGRVPFEKRQRWYDRHLAPIITEKIYPQLKQLPKEKQELPLEIFRNFLVPDFTLIMMDGVLEKPMTSFNAFLREHAAVSWFSENETDRKERATWLSSEDNYGCLRGYWREGRFVGITADLTDREAMLKLAGWLKENKKPPVTAVYVSNVGEWVGTEGTRHMYRALAELPLDENALALVSYGAGLPAASHSFRRMLWAQGYVFADEFNEMHMHEYLFGTMAVYRQNRPDVSWDETLLGYLERAMGISQTFSPAHEKFRRISEEAFNKETGRYKDLVDEIKKSEAMIKNLDVEGFEKRAGLHVPGLSTKTDYFRGFVFGLVEYGLIKPSPLESDLASLKDMGQSIRKPSFDQLVKDVENQNPRVRQLAIMRLGKVNSEIQKSVRILIRLLDDPFMGPRISAMLALRNIGPPAKEAIPFLEKYVDDDQDEYVRLSAINAISEIQSSDSKKKDQGARLAKKGNLGSKRDQGKSRKKGSRQEESKVQPKHFLTRRNFLRASGTAAIVTGLGVLAHHLIDREGSHGEAVTAKQNASWLRHSSRPDLESARRVVHLTTDWLRANGYPHMEVVDEYVKSFDRDDQVETGNVRGVPILGKGQDMETGVVKILVGLPGFDWLLLNAQKTKSQSVFIETVAAMIVREAWGLELIRTFPDWQKKMATDMEEFVLKSKEAHSEDDARRFFVKNAGTLERLAAQLLTNEYFELMQEVDFMAWAEKTGLYSPAISEKIISEPAYQGLKQYHEKRRNYYAYKDDYFQLFSALLVSFAGIYMKLMRKGETNYTVQIWRFYILSQSALYTETQGKEGLEPALVDAMIKGILPVDASYFKRQAEKLYKLVNPRITEVYEKVQRKNAAARLAKTAELTLRYEGKGRLRVGVASSAEGLLRGTDYAGSEHLTNILVEKLGINVSLREEPTGEILVVSKKEFSVWTDKEWSLGVGSSNIASEISDFLGEEWTVSFENKPMNELDRASEHITKAAEILRRASQGILETQKEMMDRVGRVSAQTLETWPGWSSLLKESIQVQERRFRRFMETRRIEDYGFMDILDLPSTLDALANLLSETKLKLSEISPSAIREAIYQLKFIKILIYKLAMSDTTDQNNQAQLRKERGLSKEGDEAQLAIRRELSNLLSELNVLDFAEDGLPRKIFEIEVLGKSHVLPDLKSAELTAKSYLPFIPLHLDNALRELDSFTSKNGARLVQIKIPGTPFVLDINEKAREEIDLFYASEKDTYDLNAKDLRNFVREIREWYEGLTDKSEIPFWGFMDRYVEDDSISPHLGWFLEHLYDNELGLRKSDRQILIHLYRYSLGTSQALTAVNSDFNVTKDIVWYFLVRMFSRMEASDKPLQKKLLRAFSEMMLWEAIELSKTSSDSYEKVEFSVIDEYEKRLLGLATDTSMSSVNITAVDRKVTMRTIKTLGQFLTENRKRTSRRVSGLKESITKSFEAALRRKRVSANIDVFRVLSERAERQSNFAFFSAIVNAVIPRRAHEERMWDGPLDELKQVVRKDSDIDAFYLQTSPNFGGTKENGLSRFSKFDLEWLDIVASQSGSKTWVFSGLWNFLSPLAHWTEKGQVGERRAALDLFHDLKEYFASSSPATVKEFLRISDPSIPEDATKALLFLEEFRSLQRKHKAKVSLYFEGLLDANTVEAFIPGSGAAIFIGDEVYFEKTAKVFSTAHYFEKKEEPDKKLIVSALLYAAHRVSQQRDWGQGLLRTSGLFIRSNEALQEAVKKEDARFIHIVNEHDLLFVTSADDEEAEAKELSPSEVDDGVRQPSESPFVGVGGPVGARLSGQVSRRTFLKFVGAGALLDQLDRYVAGLDRQFTLTEDSLIALEFSEGSPAFVLRFRKVGPHKVEVYLGNDLLRTVDTQTIHRERQETQGITVAQMTSLINEANSKYNLELQKNQITQPINAVLHLDGLLGLPPQLQENLLSNLLAEFVARSSTSTHVKLVGEKFLKDLVFKIIEEGNLVKRDNLKLFLKDDESFPDKTDSEVHLIFQKDLLHRDESGILKKDKILKDYPNARFITLSDIQSQSDPKDKKANVFAFSAVLSLLEQVGILDELSASSIDKAYDLYQSRTGYKITREQFLLLLQGDEAMAKQFPFPPLMAIDINNAIRVYFLAARMAEQSA